MKKLVLIDGHSLAFRAFYALPLTMKTTSGLYTNAVYGFTNMLHKILDDIKPDYVLVAFDKGRKTFRTEMYADYKGTRTSMPEELREQVGYIEEILAAYNIKQIALEGYEADDIIGTIAKKAEIKGDISTIIITGDRDSYQLVSPNTIINYTRKGISDIVQMDLAAVKEKYGIEPKQLIDVKALMGDKSDNIPGVMGVGEKTALKLINKYHSLEEVYNNINDIKGKSLPIKLQENKDTAFLSYKLAKINCDIPIELNWQEILFTKPSSEQLYSIYSKFQFDSLLKGLELDNNSAEEFDEINVKQIEKGIQGDELLNKIKSEKMLYFYLSFNEQQHEILYIVNNGEVYQVNKEVWSSLPWHTVWEDRQVQKITHELKSVWHILKTYNINIDGVVFDTELAGYVLDPLASKYRLDSLIAEYLTPKKKLSAQQIQSSFPYQVLLLPSLYQELKQQLVDQKLNGLYYNIELPLALVLATMEQYGIAVDKSVLEQMSEELDASIELAKAKIYQLAGEEFNVNSPKQLSSILFEKLSLPVIKKTKTGYSTAHEVLETLALEHELPALIISYRQLAKLKSTYIDGLIPLISENNRLHTTFQQTITATGRLSSTEPNLQNIPIRMEEGRRIRKAFVPGEGYDYLLAADYSQIELRILAHMSNDSILKQSFNNNEDVHTRTAAEVFGVKAEEVTKEMRTRAKAVNFGIVYGISDYGLARDLKITRKEAASYIDNYFNRYQGVRNYLDNTIIEAKAQGYVETLMNRRRYLPEINSRNFHRRSFAERTATNTPIQGSAADLIKLAMVELQNKLIAGGYKSRMLLQVHDELILEVTENELTIVAQLLEDTMKNAMDLSVPIKVDMKLGVNWYEMEELECQNYQK